MTIILDTSIIIDIERKRKETIEKLRIISEHHPAPARITFITLFEFIYGINVRKPSEAEKSIMFLELFTYMNPTKETARILAGLKRKYEEKGENFTLADLMIASQAVEHNMTLITKDKVFEKIEELDKIII